MWDEGRWGGGWGGPYVDRCYTDVAEGYMRGCEITEGPLGSWRPRSPGVVLPAHARKCRSATTTPLAHRFLAGGRRTQSAPGELECRESKSYQLWPSNTTVAENVRFGIDSGAAQTVIPPTVSFIVVPSVGEPRFYTQPVLNPRGTKAMPICGGTSPAATAGGRSGRTSQKCGSLSCRCRQWWMLGNASCSRGTAAAWTSVTPLTRILASTSTSPGRVECTSCGSPVRLTTSRWRLWIGEQLRAPGRVPLFRGRPRRSFKTSPQGSSLLPGAAGQQPGMHPGMQAI
jgi:hypothetical protein